MIRWAGAVLLLCCHGMSHAETGMLKPDWEYVSDAVMGGVSSGQAAYATIAGRNAFHMTGTVSLENNGGFIQVAFDLADGQAFDASEYSGISLDVLGNGQTYDVRLRTSQLTQPWQSFRSSFTAPQTWTQIRIPFDAFEPHRTDKSFDPAYLRRIGVLAVGQKMQADIAIADVHLY